MVSWRRLSSKPTSRPLHWVKVETMIIRLERGQKLYVADEPDRIFEGALLDLELARNEAQLDPLAELTLDPATKTWRRAPLPKGPARRARLTIVHDEENEARHYARRGYTSPLGDPGVWAHPSKRVWTLAINEPQAAAAPTDSPVAQPAVTVQLFPTTPRRDAAAAPDATPAARHARA
jgi:hypothetical protein